MRLELAAKWSFSAEQSHCLICGVAGDICAQRTSIYTGEDSLLMSKFFGVPALSSANFFFSFMQCFRNIGKKSAGPCPVADPLVGGIPGTHPPTNQMIFMNFFPHFANCGIGPLANSRIPTASYGFGATCLRNPGSTSAL